MPASRPRAGNRADGVSWVGLNPPDEEAAAGGKAEDAPRVPVLRGA